MDQDLSWWASVVFDGWRDRPGPHYQRLAGALLDAVVSRVLPPGARVPAERALARAAGVSRGTVVACFDSLVSAGVLRRRQGSGTYVVGRPSWASAAAPADRVAGLLRRRMAGDVIDLSVSSPADLRHLPPVDLGSVWSGLDGDGLDPRGLYSLRAAVARHLTVHQQLPTSAEQLVITAGAQEALWVLGRVLRSGRVLVSCPTYPGLADASGTDVIVPVPADTAGTDANALARRGAAAGGPGQFSAAAGGPGQFSAVAFVMPTGHNPTGLVMPSVRRQAIAAVADARRTVIVEDLALADLVLGDFPLGGGVTPQPQPLAALSSEVIALGSVSKLLWGGLRVGWIRLGSDQLLAPLLARKAALNLATSSVGQAVAAELLTALDADWLRAHRGALTQRRDHLCGLIGTLLPAWRIPLVPEAGLSLWVRLPVADASAFVHVAASHGVVVADGGRACVDGSHRGFVRLSFASPLEELTLAVERLAAAWEVHAQNLAAGVA